MSHNSRHRPFLQTALRVIRTSARHVAHPAWLVVLVAACVTVAAALYGPRAVGGSDEYGYLSQADLWLDGNLKIAQPFVKQVPWRRAEWFFSPHGYRPHPDDPSAIVPIYAPGLPLLLALAKRLGGQAAMFYVVPLSAGLLIVGTYAIGRRLNVEMAGLIAALMVAASPVVLFMSTHVMTDVPVAAAWAWVFYFLVGRSTRSAVAAGLLASLAVLIRPNLAPLAGVLAARYMVGMRFPTSRRRTFVLLVGFTAGLLPGIAGVAIINDYLYGSPLRSGYSDIAAVFVWARVPINLRQYLQWFAEAHTPLALLGILAVLVPLRRLWPDVEDRSLFLVMGAFVVGVWFIYCGWVIFDAWWFTRFLLPSWPFIMLGFGSAVVWAFRNAPAWGRVLVIAGVVAVSLFEVRFAVEHHPYAARQGRRRFVTVARLVQRMTDRNSVIVSLDHSGSIRYYGGRITMNSFWIPSGPMLDRIVDWHLEHGVRTYLAAEEFELPEMRRRFTGNKCMLALERPPLAIYEEPGRTLLFDLTEPRPPGAKPLVERGTAVVRTATPVPLPRLIYRDVPQLR
jgi:Dolichyl-phosphate-mannose-protein mannosyltransferase